MINNSKTNSVLPTLEAQKALQSNPQGIAKNTQAIAPSMVQQQAQVSIEDIQTLAAQRKARKQIAKQQVQIARERKLAREKLTLQKTQRAKDVKANTTLTNEELKSRKMITTMDSQATERLLELGIEQDNTLQLLSIGQRQNLERIGRDVKSKIFDSRIQFDRDEMGRKFRNERQLADYSILNAETNQAFEDKMRASERTHNRKIQMLETIYKNLGNQLSQNFQESEQRLSFEHQKQIAQIRENLRKAIAKAKKKANNTQMMWQGGGMILGAAAGAVLAAPTGGASIAAGATAGATLGGGLGSIFGASQSDDEVKNPYENEGY